MHSMEIKLPYDSCEALRQTTSRPYTHDRIVLAANHIGRALVSGANTSDGDGRAVQTQKDIKVRQDDAEQV
jgi:hypothetical protein